VTFRDYRQSKKLILKALPNQSQKGQSFEAGALDGVENAPDPDVAEVKTREFPEDDVPSEYLESN